MKNVKQDIEQELKLALEERVTVDLIRQRAKQSRKSILGYKRGYTITQEALNHSYNAKISTLK